MSRITGGVARGNVISLTVKHNAQHPSIMIAIEPLSINDCIFSRNSKPNQTQQLRISHLLRKHTTSKGSQTPTSNPTPKQHVFYRHPPSHFFGHSSRDPRCLFHLGALAEAARFRSCCPICTVVADQVEKSLASNATLCHGWPCY